MVELDKQRHGKAAWAIALAHKQDKADGPAKTIALIERISDAIAKAECAAMSAHQELLADVKTALEHASFALDGVVALDDEDEGKDGGSATCQHAKRTVDRALAKVVKLLGGTHGN